MADNDKKFFRLKDVSLPWQTAALVIAVAAVAIWRLGVVEAKVIKYEKVKEDVITLKANYKNIKEDTEEIKQYLKDLLKELRHE